MLSWHSREIQPWRLRLGSEPKLAWSKGAGSLESCGVAGGETLICSGKSPIPAQRAQRPGGQRPMGRIKFRNQSPRPRRGERVPFAGVLPFVVEHPCGWLARCRPPLPAECRVDVQISKWQLEETCWAQTLACASVLRVAGTQREQITATLWGWGLLVAHRKAFKQGVKWDLKPSRVFAWSGLFLSAATEWAAMSKALTRGQKDWRKHRFSLIGQLKLPGKWGLHSPLYPFPFHGPPAPKAMPLKVLCKSSYCCVTVRWSTVVGIDCVLAGVSCLGRAWSVGQSCLSCKCGWCSSFPAAQVLAAPRVLILGPQGRGSTYLGALLMVSMAERRVSA